jgi:hypothetical protein
MFVTFHITGFENHWFFEFFKTGFEHTGPFIFTSTGFESTVWTHVDTGVRYSS